MSNSNMGTAKLFKGQLATPRGVTCAQEEFWSGNFGDEYSERNGDECIPANINLFSQILRRTEGVKSVLEFGANIGLNLQAIDCLLPRLNSITAVEINGTACKGLRVRMGDKVDIVQESILHTKISTHDFVFTKGVLIHINPEYLGMVYDKIFEASGKYICVAEYYSPKPVNVEYRGHEERLFKRDFAGEMLARFPSLHLVDYGFCYHGDQNFPMDDITWFLLQKP